MTSFEIGDRLAFQGRVYFLRGFSPMSVRPRRLLLEDSVSRQTVELVEAELARDRAAALRARPGAVAGEPPGPKGTA